MNRFPRRFALLILILLASTFLRLYRLDARALWWDEGLSLFFAQLDFRTNALMAVKLADTNPPVYRLLLGAWVRLVGSSAFASRLFSVVPGVILIAIVYRLARQLRFSCATAVTAAALCAASPMLIYYSQEAKGYSLVSMAGAASAAILLHLITDATRRRRKRWAWGALWALNLLLALGSHYIAAFLIALENLWAAIFTVRRWRGSERRWVAHWLVQLGGQGLVAAILVPFVGLTFGGTSAAVRGETGEFSGLDGPLEFFGRHAIELTQGPRAEGAWALALAAAILALAAVGSWKPKAGAAARWLLLSWIIIPVVLGFALNFYHQFFFPRFVLYAVPPLMILAAEGMRLVVSRLSHLRLTRWFWSGEARPLFAATLLIVALWTPQLVTHYTTPSDPAEDWRLVAEAMRPLIRENDAAIYGWGWMPGYLSAYLPPAPQPHFSLGFFTPQSLDAEMNAIIAGRSRVWLLDYRIDQFDERNAAGRWLGERAALVYDDWPGGGRAHIALFALEPSPTLEGEPITAEFANGLRLATHTVAAQLAPGDALAVRLEWQAERPIPERWTIFLHGLAADGSLAFGRDSEPRNGFDPLNAWQPNSIHTELRGAIVPPDLPPDTYRLQVGIYNTATGAADGQPPVPIGSIIVR